MTDSFPPGASELPDARATTSRRTPAELERDPFPRRGSDALSDELSADAPATAHDPADAFRSAELGGASPSAADPAVPRRRRRRGGRRRSGGRAARGAEPFLPGTPAEPLFADDAEADDIDAGPGEAAPLEAHVVDDLAVTRAPGRSGRKRGRRRSRSGVRPSDAPSLAGDERAHSDDAPTFEQNPDLPLLDVARDALAGTPGSLPSRKRRGRRGRGRRRSEEREFPSPEEARERLTEEPRLERLEPAPGETLESPGPRVSEDDSPRRRRRRGGRGRGRARDDRPREAGARAQMRQGPVEVEGIPGEEDELTGLAQQLGSDELPELPDDAHMLSPPELERAPQLEHARPPRRGRRSRGGRGERGREPREVREDLDDELAPAPRPGRKNLILVNASDKEETRVAVVEGGAIVDFQMKVKRHESLVNDIYRGRVVNLEPAIGAAFVDFGQGRNGFLHTSDVLSAYGDADWSLEKLLTTKVDPDEWDEESGPAPSSAEVGGEPAAEGAEAENGEDSAEVDGDRRGRERSRRDSPPAHAARAGRGRSSAGRMGASGRRARPRLPITDLLKKGQSVVVQVTKDAIGDKGPTLTTYISIPGRYLVLMPSMARTGVSRKIDDEKERRRLKRILESLAVPPGMGVIVRTAGTGCTKADLKRDLDYLMLLWESFGQRLTLGRGPAPLYEESDVAIRTIRDLFTDHTEAVIVDEPRMYERVREFTEKLMPENVERIKLHTAHKPLFHAHNVEQDFERIFARRIDLASGGSIVFDQTEALVAIDVNSGKTRSEGFDFEDIALRTNLDAVAEIARQIRLRDLGGIIVCDFIDMQKNSNRRSVERALQSALTEDRARSKLGRISQFGLLELTRQRLGPGMSRMLFFNCPRCRGSGRLRTTESRAGAILRRLGSALSLKGFSRVEIRTQPEVIEYLERHCVEELKELEIRHERELVLIPAPDQVEDCVLRYVGADGREVRPGGRRKR